MMSAAQQIPLTLPEIAEAQALHHRGVSLEDIADRLASTVDAVRDAVEGRKGPHTDLYQSGRQLRTMPVSAAEARQIGRLADLGTPIGDIADMFGITVGRADFLIGEGRRKRDREAGSYASHAEGVPAGPRIGSDARSRLPASPECQAGESPPLEPSMADLLRPPMPNTDSAARQAEENRLRALYGASFGGKHRRR